MGMSQGLWWPLCPGQMATGSSGWVCQCLRSESWLKCLTSSCPAGSVATVSIYHSFPFLWLCTPLLFSPLTYTQMATYQCTCPRCLRENKISQEEAFWCLQDDSLTCTEEDGSWKHGWGCNRKQEVLRALGNGASLLFPDVTSGAPGPILVRQMSLP